MYQNTLLLLRSKRLRRLFRYLCSGVTAALLNIGILFVLVEFGQVHYLPASICAVLGSMVAGFTLQKFWTFKDLGLARTHVQFTGYAVVSALNLVVNTSVMYIFVSLLGVWYIAAQIIAGGCIAVTGYIGYRNFVFKAACDPQ